MSKRYRLCTVCTREFHSSQRAHVWQRAPLGIEGEACRPCVERIHAAPTPSSLDLLANAGRVLLNL